jgi:arylformamidase
VIRLIDVSLGIDGEMLVWPGDPAVSVDRTKRIAAGDAANVSELRIGTHTGTHVDPPVHFIEGAAGIDAVPLDLLVGEAFVADLRAHDGPLAAADLEGAAIPAGVTRLLLRTANSELWRRARPITFPDMFACLTEDGARWALDRGIRLVGVDFLSVEAKASEGHPVHHLLLGNGAVIVEGLDLGGVEPGRLYEFVCLPLKILAGDGGPARALLIER